jgi:IS30 family transposase
MVEGSFAIAFIKGSHMSHKTRAQGREPYQKKRSKSGHQSRKGVPEDYDEVKKSTSFGITPTAKSGLNVLAKKNNISVSEFIERIGRGTITVSLDSTSTCVAEKANEAGHDNA